MTSACRKYFLEAIQLSDQFIKLANDAQSDCDDDRCMVLFGIVLDSASKIRLEAEKRLKLMEVETVKYGCKVVRAFALNPKTSV